MMKIKNIRSIICLVIIFIFTNQALAADWAHYGSTMSGDFYYDKSSITKISPNISRVWFLIKLSSSEKNNTIQNVKRFKQYHYGWEKLDSQMLLYEINCVNHTGKTLKLGYYDNNDTAIFSSEYQNPTIDNINPGSVNNTLLKKVCYK